MKKLIFEEHFEGEGLPNAALWNVEEAGHGFGNKEAQFYTARLENVYVKDSLLHIVARKEAYQNRLYTSAKITTYQKKHFTYGYFEVRMKLPKGKGTWPALWFLGTKRNEGYGWPLCGEIDLMEYVGKHEDVVHFSLHSKKKNHLLGNNVHFKQYIEGLTDDFHIFGMRWDKDGFAYYVDDVLLTTVTKGSDTSYEAWPF